jgi:signal transduction histidine kinase
LDLDMPHLHDVVAVALFRIFQEAMTNILRHAKASQVWIWLGYRGDRVLLRVCDNGTGIGKEHARSARSIGLKGMRERAAIAGGRLVLGPLKPSGTLVAVSVPLVEDRSSSSLAMAPILHAGEVP